MFLSLYLILRISSLYLFPLQFSHFILISAINCMSTEIYPSPLHFSHLPPSTLNEKYLGVIFFNFDNFWFENNFLISSNPFKYVIKLDLLDFPIAFCCTYSIFLILFISQLIKLFWLLRNFLNSGINISFNNVLFPEPLTPVIVVRIFMGNLVLIFLILFFSPPFK